MPDFDFPAFVTAPRYFPHAGDQFHPWCYRRPDGTCVTVIGHERAVLAIDGNHTPGEPHKYDVKPEQQPGYRKPISGKAMDNLLNKPTQPVATISLAAFRELVGEPVSDEGHSIKPCDECGGSGTKECYHCLQDMECDECDGKGKIETHPFVPRRLLEINGFRYNTTFVAPLLHGLPDCQVAIAEAAGSSWRIMFVTGDGWRLIFVSLDNDHFEPEEGDVTAFFTTLTESHNV
jgi:hypothetical protein